LDKTCDGQMNTFSFKPIFVSPTILKINLIEHTTIVNNIQTFSNLEVI